MVIFHCFLYVYQRVVPIGAHGFFRTFEPPFSKPLHRRSPRRAQGLREQDPQKYHRAKNEDLMEIRGVCIYIVNIYVCVYLHHPNIGFETRLFDEVWICSNKPGIITLVKTYDQWDIFPVAGDPQVIMVVSILSHGPMTWMISGYHHGFGKLHEGIQWDFMRNHWDIPGIIGYNLDIGIKHVH